MPARLSLMDELDIIRERASSAPVDVIAIAQDLGLEPTSAVMENNIAGYIRRDDLSVAGYRIFYNREHHRFRQRFTVAHELGHYMMHRDLLGEGVGDDIMYRDGPTNLDNKWITPVEERQANTYAANLLMPLPLIQHWRERGVSAIADLAEKFDVSVEAMRIRLGR